MTGTIDSDLRIIVTPPVPVNKKPPFSFRLPKVAIKPYFGFRASNNSIEELSGHSPEEGSAFEIDEKFGLSASSVTSPLYTVEPWARLMGARGSAVQRGKPSCDSFYSKDGVPIPGPTDPKPKLPEQTKWCYTHEENKIRIKNQCYDISPATTMESHHIVQNGAVKDNKKDGFPGVFGYHGDDAPTILLSGGTSEQDTAHYKATIFQTKLGNGISPGYGNLGIEMDFAQKALEESQTATKGSIPNKKEIDFAIACAKHYFYGTANPGAGPLDPRPLGLNPSTSTRKPGNRK